MKFKKYFNWKHLTIVISILALIVPLECIYVFYLKRTWYDGLSVSSAIIGLFALLGIIFVYAKFKPFSKIKNLFVIKNETKTNFTKFEKMQMQVLNLSVYPVEKKEKIKEFKKSINWYFIWTTILIVCLILLLCSIPFFFI